MGLFDTLPQPPPALGRLGHFPIEVREEIYTFVVASSSPFKYEIKHSNGDNNTFNISPITSLRHSPANLLLVSDTIMTEAIKLFWQHNKFSIKLEDEEEQPRVMVHPTREDDDYNHLAVVIRPSAVVDLIKSKLIFAENLAIKVEMVGISRNLQHIKDQVGTHHFRTYYFRFKTTRSGGVPITTVVCEQTARIAGTQTEFVDIIDREDDLPFLQRWNCLKEFLERVLQGNWPPRYALTAPVKRDLTDDGW